MYVCACVMCAVFDNRSSDVAPEHNTHSVKNVPNNLFSVHGTSWEYVCNESHKATTCKPRAIYHKTRATLRRNIKHDRLKERKESGTQSKRILGIRRRSGYSFTLQQYYLGVESPGTPYTGFSDLISKRDDQQKNWFSFPGSDPRSSISRSVSLSLSLSLFGNRQLVHWTGDSLLLCGSKLIIFITETHQWAFVSNPAHTFATYLQGKD